MDDKRIIGMAANAEYARWAHRETDPEDIFKKPEALDDMLVIDASQGNYAGLFASSILSELGAEVIRVEAPGGDIARKMSPYGMMVKDSGLAYLTEARNKFHVTLDIETQEGVNIFKRLARKADVVIETFKPGYLDERGAGYRQLAVENPGLIYCPIYVYGQFGKDAEKCGNQPDYDITNQARGVIMSITGEPDLDPEVPPEYKRPLRQGNWMGWYAGGAWAAFGIMTAVYYKRKSGQGQMVDCSPPEGLLAISNYVMQYYHMSRTLCRVPETMTMRFFLTPMLNAKTAIRSSPDSPIPTGLRFAKSSTGRSFAPSIQPLKSASIPGTSLTYSIRSRLLRPNTRPMSSCALSGRT